MTSQSLRSMRLPRPLRRVSLAQGPRNDRNIAFGSWILDVGLNMESGMWNLEYGILNKPGLGHVHGLVHV